MEEPGGLERGGTLPLARERARQGGWGGGGGGRGWSFIPICFRLGELRKGGDLGGQHGCRFQDQPLPRLSDSHCPNITVRQISELSCNSGVTVPSKIIHRAGLGPVFCDTVTVTVTHAVLPSCHRTPLRMCSFSPPGHARSEARCVLTGFRDLAVAAEHLPPRPTPRSPTTTPTSTPACAATSTSDPSL